MRVPGLCGSAALAVWMVFAGSAQVSEAQTNLKCQGVWSGTVISGSASGSAQIEMDVHQSGGALGGMARITQGMAVNVGPITGSATTGSSTTGETILINLGTLGQMAATINVSGTTSAGTYTMMDQGGSVTDNGVLALNQQNVVTPNVSGIYIGTTIQSGYTGPSNQAMVFLIQTGNSLYVSTAWHSSLVFNGTGTIIGNKITFQAVESPGLSTVSAAMLGSATFANGTISGTSTTSTVGAGISASSFATSFIMPIQ